MLLHENDWMNENGWERMQMHEWLKMNELISEFMRMDEVGMNEC
jgi:hypothetical protein